ncbi:hypothetical protein GGI15_003485 [Coemansia interrupta]|uniref:Uncharacterized protein n=1 Tax=Coemansia interrupta TaxID=1126814 RepID=A0A9W8HCA3_9FUNG|nr:hypothetical protein GGI15_003485 [Coemansia interrupta]
MEFSQRPAHSTFSGAHSYMPAAAPPPAHHQYLLASKGGSANQPLYTQRNAAASASANEAYPGAPRRLPSVSELLISPDTVQQAAVAGHASRDLALLSMQQHKYSTNATGVFGTSSAYPAAESQMAYGIDVPAPRHAQDAATGDYVAAAYHRNSESASSVSSHETLVDGGAMLSNPQYHTYSKQNTRHIVASQNQQQQQQMVVSCMCEDDVFAAASILMSLRTCRMP